MRGLITGACDKVTAEHRQSRAVGAPSQSRSTATRLRSASEQKLKAPSCVARKTTRGARPACSASCHRGAHRHQRSPGLSPGKPNSETAVERSLPQDFEYSRNPAVMTAHTVWLPMSSRLVSQHPSRKNPVIGLKEHTSSRSPSTFLAADSGPTKPEFDERLQRKAPTNRSVSRPHGRSKTPPRK